MTSLQDPPQAPPRKILQRNEIRRNRLIAAMVTLAVMATVVIALLSRPDHSAPTSTQRTALSGAAAKSSAQLQVPPSNQQSGAAAAPSAPVTAMPATSSGTFTRVVVPGAASKVPGRVVTFALEVEDGLKTDNAAIAATVHSALFDARGWQSVDRVRFAQVSPTQLAAGTRPDVDIVIASPRTVDKLCAPLDTGGEWSCGQRGKAVLNYDRWANGVPFIEDRNTYRLYMVNHEVGHNLGHGHTNCGGAGQAAPVMQQQSMGLHGCTAWPWPQPPKR